MAPIRKAALGWKFAIAVGTCLALCSGCSDYQQVVPPIAKRPGIAFLEQVKSNADVPKELGGVSFTDTSGSEVTLGDYLGKKHVVLVFTQGFSGMLCPFCKTQTSRLITNYQKFADLDAEVFVVYPGTRDHLEEFIEAAKTQESHVAAVPFPILLDEDLRGTRFFNIVSEFAHPSTFIIDKNGDVKLAYVGADRSADRPSIEAMLSILETAQN